MTQKVENIEAILPLRFIQKALYLHRETETKDSGFLQVQCKIVGELTASKFQQAWLDTIARHDSLRSSIHSSKSGKLVQVVHNESKNNIAFKNIRKLSSEEQTDLISHFLIEDKQRGIGLTDPAHNRMTLFQLSDDVHHLIWSCHHILLDGWSSVLIIEDILMFYSDRADELEKISSTKDYRLYELSQNNQESQNFWTDYLSGLETSILKPYRSEQNELNLYLGAEKRQAISEFCKRNRITEFSLYQGLWFIALASESGETDFPVGTVVSGRHHDYQGIQSMAGLFMKVLPIRIKVKDVEQKLVAFLQSIQRNQGEWTQHQDVSLEDIIGWRADSGSLSISNLLVVQNFLNTQKVDTDLVAKNFESGITTTYPLTLSVLPSAENIRIQLKYSIDIHLEPKSISEVQRTDSIPDVESHFNGPKNSVELAMTTIWQEVLNKSGIERDSDFFAMGGTSVQAITIFSRIEKQLGKTLSPSILVQRPTIATLAETIEANNDSDSISCLVPLKGGGSKPVLYCVHSGGAHILVYKLLSAALAVNQGVIAIQPLSLVRKEDGHQSVEEMAAHYLKEILTTKNDGPFYLLGYCFSAAVTFEMAKQYYQKTGDFPYLIMVDTAPTNEELKGEQGLNKQSRVARLTSALVKGQMGEVATMIKNQFVYAKIGLERARSSQTEKELRALRGKLDSIYMKYKWEYIPCHIYNLRSSEASEKSTLDFHNTNWLKVAKSQEISIVQSGHYDIFDMPNVQNLAQAIDRIIEKNLS